MALISCPDCGSQISDAAPACIWCGRPNPEAAGASTQATAAQQTSDLAARGGEGSREHSVEDAALAPPETRREEAGAAPAVSQARGGRRLLGIIGVCLLSIVFGYAIVEYLSAPSAEQCRAWRAAARDGSSLLRSTFRDIPGGAFDAAMKTAKEKQVGAGKIQRCRELGYW